MVNKVLRHGSTKDYPTPNRNGSCPGHAIPVPTLLDLLKEKYPDTMILWDRWDYTVLSPVSLDDAPIVQVVLKNKSGKFFSWQIPLDGAGYEHK